MTKVRMIVWDMDGTIADLYGVDGWLEMLRAENPLPYEMAEPMWDMERLVNIIRGLQDFGIEQRVVSWLSMNSSEQYKREVRQTKREWLDEFDFPYDHFHGVQYGATKADSVRKYLAEDETAILIDDSFKVREGWHLGETVDPTEVDIIDFLGTLLESLIEE